MIAALFRAILFVLRNVDRLMMRPRIVVPEKRKDED